MCSFELKHCISKSPHHKNLRMTHRAKIIISLWAWIHLSGWFSKELLAESRALKHNTGNCDRERCWTGTWGSIVLDKGCWSLELEALRSQWMAGVGTWSSEGDYYGKISREGRPFFNIKYFWLIIKKSWEQHEEQVKSYSHDRTGQANSHDTKSRDSNSEIDIASLSLSSMSQKIQKKE